MNINSLEKKFSYFKLSFQSIFKLIVIFSVGTISLVNDFEKSTLWFFTFLFISILPFVTMRITTNEDSIRIFFGEIFKKEINFDFIKSVRILNKEENWGIYRFYARSLWGVKITLFPFRLVFDVSDGFCEYVEITMLNDRKYLIGIAGLFDSDENSKKLKEIILNRVKLINLEK